MSRNSILKIGGAGVAALAGVILAITSVGAHASMPAGTHTAGWSLLQNIVGTATRGSLATFKADPAENAFMHATELESESDAAELAAKEAKEAAELAAKKRAAAAKAAEEAKEAAEQPCLVADRAEETAEEASGMPTDPQGEAAAGQTEDAAEPATGQADDSTEPNCGESEQNGFGDQGGDNQISDNSGDHGFGDQGD